MLGHARAEFEEVVTGEAEVREVFRVPRSVRSPAATCGTADHPGSKVRFLREGAVIWKGAISSLRRFKDDVREVQPGSSVASASPTSRTSRTATSSRPTKSARSQDLTAASRCAAPGRMDADGQHGLAAAPYPLARVNQLLRQVLAEELERLADADERLRLVTVTSVDSPPTCGMPPST